MRNSRRERRILFECDAGAYTIDVPKGWTTTADPSKAMVTSQQDPKSKDAAQLLVLVVAIIDAKGGLVSKYNGVHSSNNGGGNFQVNGDTTGTLQIGNDRVIMVVRKGSANAFYLLRGWFVGPELTVMRLNGPYYEVKDIDDGVRQDRTAGNLDELWVRKTR